jgi:hypothetical protein
VTEHTLEKEGKGCLSREKLLVPVETEKPSAPACLLSQNFHALGSSIPRISGVVPQTAFPPGGSLF